MRLLTGDCLEIMPQLVAEGVQVDACVTDPPYHLTSIVKRFGKEGSAEAKSNGATGVYKRASRGFMGCTWDGGDVAMNPETWAHVYDLLKPGGHLIALCGTRTEHRVACAIEDAGFEIRDRLLWLYGSGFPKSHDVSKAIDRAAGAEREVVGEYVARGFSDTSPTEDGRNQWAAGPVSDKVSYRTAPATDAARQWQGWGTALKPAVEIAVLARKPLSEGSVAANVLKHETGALNVDACRVATGENLNGGKTSATYVGCKDGWRRPFQDDASYMAERAKLEADKVAKAETLGRWPANVLHDGSPEVMEAFARFGERATHPGTLRNAHQSGNGATYDLDRTAGTVLSEGDTGTAARFFYCAKATAEERAGTSHPTVKPLALMEWLVRLVTPPKGLVLDPFAGSGSTLIACDRLEFDAIGIEQDAKTVAEAEERLKRHRARRHLGPDAERVAPLPGQLGLFGDAS